MSNINLSGDSSMQEVIDAYPGAQRALFQKYHMGGCQSCGYEPEDKLQEVCANHDAEVGDVLGFLNGIAENDAKLEASVQEVAEALKSSNPPKMLDVRTQEEWNAANIEGARLFTREVNMELSAWPKDTPVVFYCHTGVRSLDAASFFLGHGFTHVKSMKGGIEAWAQEIDKNVPRYAIEEGSRRGQTVIKPLSASFGG